MHLLAIPIERMLCGYPLVPCSPDHSPHMFTLGVWQLTELVGAQVEGYQSSFTPNHKTITISHHACEASQGSHVPVPSHRCIVAKVHASSLQVIAVKTVESIFSTQPNHAVIGLHYTPDAQLQGLSVPVLELIIWMRQGLQDDTFQESNDEHKK